MNTKHACQKTPARSAITPEPPPQTETPAFAGESDPITRNLDETQQEIDKWSARIKGPLPDMMTNWVIPLYMNAVREELKTVTDNTQRLKLLTQHSLTAARLQRAADSSAKRQLERERVDLEKEKFRLITAPAIEKKRPDYMRPFTDKERRAVIAKVDDIMGTGPKYTRESFEANYRELYGSSEDDPEPDTPPATSNAVPEAPVSSPARPVHRTNAAPQPATLSENATAPKSRSSRRKQAQTFPATPKAPLVTPNPPETTTPPAPSTPKPDPRREYEDCLFRMRTNQEPWDQKKLNRLKSALPPEQNEEQEHP